MIEELNSSDDDDIPTRTPKRRAADRPGSSPFAHIPTRGKPYSERRRRREVEAQGRIHSTLLRLPELVAQTEADARARAAKGDDNSLTADHPSPPSASTPSPVTPQRGWRFPSFSFRSLIPSLSGLLSPRRDPPTLDVGGDSMSPPVQASGLQVPSETLTMHSETVPSQLPGSDAPKEKEPGQKVRQLTYSLFPEPIDKTPFLTPRSRLGTSDSKAGAEAPHSGEEPRKSERKRRRRRASPDAIPNPPGSSYGMDLRYFVYSSESYDDSSEDEVHAGPSQVPVRGILQSKRPRPKRVRFAASPPDAPSKLRFAETATESNTASPAQMPTSSLRAGRTDPDSYQPVVPNKTGTFTLDYDLFSSDDSDTAAPSETGARVPGPPALSSAPAPSTVAGTMGEPAPSGPSGSDVLRTSVPTPLGAGSEGSPIHHPPPAANAVEISRRSSSSTVGWSNAGLGQSAVRPELDMLPFIPRVRGIFGESDGEETYWILKHCPSADFSRIVWPEPTGYAESLNVSSEAVGLANSVWRQDDVSAVYPEFVRSIDLEEADDDLIT